MKLAFLLLLTGVALGQIADPHANNTSGCSGNGQRYAGCSAAFPGASDTAGNVGLQTVVVDAAPGNVSPLSLHTLIYPGWTGRLLCHYMPWFYPGSPHITSPGMDETQQNTVTAQVAAMVAEGCDAADIDWYGSAGPAQRLTVTSNMFTASSGTSFKVAITEDEGSVTVVCPLNGGGATQATQVTCISNAIIADMDYIHTNYAANPNYLLSGSNPEIFFFMDLTDWTNPVLDAAHRQSIWTAVKAHTAAYGTPFKLLFEQGDYTTSPDGGGLSDGNYGWAKPYTYDIVKQFCWDVTGTGCAGTEYVGTMYAQFIASAKLNVGLLQAGFDDNIGSFGSNRVTAQRCGQTLQETAAAFNTALSGSGKTADLMLVTWNDYEEGTEFETGINNCYTVSQSISGNTLTPTLNKTDATYSTISTIDHLKVIYKTAGGQYFTAQDSIAPATATIPLAGIIPARTAVTVYTQAVGIAGVQNQISSGTSFIFGAVYIAQVAAGANDGTSCANAKAYTYFNTAGNWSATPTGIQIGPDVTVHLCGTINGPNTVGSLVLSYQGNGSSGHPMTLFWESGASISVPSCKSGIGASNSGCINLNGHTNLVIDMNGQPNAITATANGSAPLANHLDSVAIFTSTFTNNELKNCSITHMYDHTSTTDVAGGFGYALQTSGGSNSSIHDCTFDNLYAAFDDSYQNGDNAISFYNNTCNHFNWCVHIGNNSVASLTNVFLHDNHLMDMNNWDTTTDAFHHDGLFVVQNNPSATITNIFFYNNLADGNMSQCTISVIGPSGSCATAWIFYNTGMNGIYVFNNVLQNPFGSVGFMLEGGFSGDKNFFFYNNFIDCGSTGNGLNYSNVVGWVFENNALQNCNVAGGTNYYNLTNITSKTSQYNVYKNFASGEAHSINTSNLNVNASGQPLSGSPMILAGLNLFGTCSGQPNPGLGSLCFDKSGVLRSASLPWDIGAFVFASQGPGGTIINNAILNNTVTQ